MESVQPGKTINEQSGAKVVYIVVYESQFEGQTLMGIYSTEEAAEQALQQATDEDSSGYSVKEIAMDRPAVWDLLNNARKVKVKPKAAARKRETARELNAAADRRRQQRVVDRDGSIRMIGHR